jgi:hypothetical protein
MSSLAVTAVDLQLHQDRQNTHRVAWVADGA